MRLSLVAEFGDAVPIVGSSWEVDARTLTSRIRDRMPFFTAIVATDVSHDWSLIQTGPVNNTVNLNR
jgi:hypothetical protein